MAVKGLPTNEVTVRKGLGMRLVNAFAAQLGGKLSCQSGYVMVRDCFCIKPAYGHHRSAEAGTKCFHWVDCSTVELPNLPARRGPSPERSQYH